MGGTRPAPISRPAWATCWGTWASSPSRSPNRSPRTITSAQLSGFEGDITKGTDAYPFDTITKDDLLANEVFGQLLYGVNWEDEMGSVPSSFSLFNGALTLFTNANNVLMYALLSGGDQIEADNYGDYLFGSDTSITAALAGETVWEDFSNFFDNGVADLGGYFDI